MCKYLDYKLKQIIYNLKLGAGINNGLSVLITIRIMKKTIFTCLFVVWMVSCFGQFTNDFHTSSNLNGKIDSLVLNNLYQNKISGKPDTTELVSRSTNIYDKKKQLIESYDYSYLQPQHSSIDSRPVKTVYIYDSNGNLTGSRRYFTTGELWVKDTYSKKDSVIVAKEFYCPDNSLTNTDRLKIDISGRITERDTYVRGVGLFTKSYFKYDGAGRLIKEDTYRDDGTLMFRHSCKYNAEGDIIEDNNPFGDRTVHTYKYEKYDQMHNWLKQIECLNGGFYIIHERVITYY